MGQTKVDKDTKVMTMVDGNRLSTGLHVDSVQPHELILTAPTLRTICVSHKCVRPKTRLKELVADKTYDNVGFQCKLQRSGIKPTVPTFEQSKRKKPKRGCLIRTVPAYRHRGKVK